MKVLALILSTAILTVLIGGASVGLVFLLPDDDAGALYFALIPVVVFAYGPLVVGSLRTYFDPARSADGKRYFQRVMWIVIGLDVLSAIAAFVFTALVGASIWLPVVTIVVAAAMLAVAVLVGDALRKRDDRLDPAEPVWRPVDRRLIRRKIATVAVTFGVAFILVTIVLSVVLRSTASDMAAGELWVNAVSFGLIFGFFASGFACVLVALPITRALRGSLNKDAGRARKFARVILQHKNIELTEEEQAPAARYASLLSVSLGFNLAYISLLYAGILLQNVTFYLREPDDALMFGLLALFLIVLYLVILPLTIRRIRRARTYANDHADLLPEAIPA